MRRSVAWSGGYFFLCVKHKLMIATINKQN
uniref:Uncharacterized protein n=1 Tax=Siphoviridae sp. ctMgg26 TaxID=2825462 RepID=A0A8S5Q191_9CAUD|nr:MAG TPA: hypothetical protein [Siphoviridae sp. ctMgg26]